MLQDYQMISLNVVVGVNAAKCFVAFLFLINNLSKFGHVCAAGLEAFFP